MPFVDIDNILYTYNFVSLVETRELMTEKMGDVP